MVSINFDRGANEQLNDINGPMKNAQNRYEDIIGTLTLFAPHSNEPAFTGPFETIELERPVTPVEEEIRRAPATLSQLQRLLRRRLQPRPNVVGVTEEDQLHLAAVLMGEVTAIWTDLHEQVDYPFFTYEQNQELNRRVTVHIITVCSELFKQQLAKAEILLKRKVYSEEANITRMSVQMAFEARDFLNVATVRRLISDEMKKSYTRMKSASGDFVYPANLQSKQQSQPTVQFQDTPANTLKKWMKINNELAVVYKDSLEGIKTKPPKHKFATVQEDLQDLSDAMPDLDTTKLIPLLRNLPRNLSALARKSTSATTDRGTSILPPFDLYGDADEEEEEMNRGHLETDDLHDNKEERNELGQLELTPSLRTRLEKHQRCGSVPHLTVGPSLMEQLEIGITNWFPSKEVDEKLLDHVEIPPDVLERQNAVHLTSLTRDVLRQDLIRLQQGTSVHPEHDPEEMPPLVRTGTNASKKLSRRQKRETIMKELDEKDAKFAAQQSFVPAKPTHAQPATLTKTMGNKVIRTSDIRPSERQCMSEVTLSLFGPVWNDLLDQIDPATVKNLDRNLFRGDEIREVYKEIMKTVPRDHLDFTKDDIVEPCPDELDVSVALASSTLRKRKKVQRVINPNFHKSSPAPWGAEERTRWGKAQVLNPSDKKGSQVLENIVDRIIREETTEFLKHQSNTGDHLRSRYPGAPIGMDVPRPCTPQPPQKYVLSLDQFDEGMRESSKIIKERLVRNYSTWLQYWKGLMDSEDYIKFLSTKETDYLSLVFHLYDSDGEEDEMKGDEAIKQAMIARKKLREVERQKRLQGLKQTKTHFEPGMWNIQSVLLGGLGHDPQVDETELLAAVPDEVIKASETEDEKRTPFIKFKSNLTAPPPLDLELDDTTQPPGVDSNQLEGTPRMTSQQRYERLWTALKMPDHIRLNLTIKYCDHRHADKLDLALDQWDKATKYVLQREAIMAQLECFERQASHPNRYFEKGYRGSSVARLDEAKKRSKYYKKLEKLDDLVREAVLSLEIEFQDILTYEGRAYLEKMKYDRTEMLYWLQEERRNFVVRHSQSQDNKIYHLPTIPNSQDIAVRPII